MSKKTREELNKENCSITLTREEWNQLIDYIGTTKPYIAERIREYQELMHQLKEDGTPRFPNAVGYVEFYLEKEASIKAISEKIYEQRFK